MAYSNLSSPTFPPSAALSPVNSMEDLGGQSRRELHVLAEQRRRQAIASALDELRAKVGTPQDSKATVLSKVITRFQELDEEVIDLRAKLDRTRRELLAHQLRDNEVEALRAENAALRSGQPASSGALPLPSRREDAPLRLPSFSHFDSLASSRSEIFPSFPPPPVSPSAYNIFPTHPRPSPVGGASLEPYAGNTVGGENRRAPRGDDAYPSAATIARRRLSSASPWS